MRTPPLDHPQGRGAQFRLRRDGRRQGDRQHMPGPAPGGGWAGGQGQLHPQPGATLPGAFQDGQLPVGRGQHDLRRTRRRLLQVGQIRRQHAVVGIAVGADLPGPVAHLRRAHPVRQHRPQRRPFGLGAPARVARPGGHERRHQIAAVQRQPQQASSLLLGAARHPITDLHAGSGATPQPSLRAAIQPLAGNARPSSPTPEARASRSAGFHRAAIRRAVSSWARPVSQATRWASTLCGTTWPVCSAIAP